MVYAIALDVEIMRDLALVFDDEGHFTGRRLCRL
jgi:hypothetical protein